jgi:D-glycero-alpha-D-manno-heptose-7-phosphate kinase
MIISTAIDKYVYVIVKERFDDKIYINYSQKEIVNDISEIKHDLVREAMVKSGITRGIEITTLADVPSEGSGLGSSSSITVCLLNALYNFMGNQVTAEQLATESCQIEIDICKKPIGKQDQFIAAYGGLKKLTFHTDGSVSVDKIDIPSNELRRLGSNLILFYTNKTRNANVILQKQTDRSEEIREELSSMRDLVPGVAEIIMKGNFDGLGNMLHENWLLKKSLSTSISNPDIDSMYRDARKAGALGGKICGAGGGGFLLLYVPRDRQDAVRESLGNYRELPFMLDPLGSRIIFNVRSYSTK